MARSKIRHNEIKKVVITCFDSRSQFYGEIDMIEASKWYNRSGNSWSYWRLATQLEADLYYQDIRHIPQLLIDSRL